MSSPTRSTRTEQFFHGSLQYVAVEDVQDTTISMAGVPMMPENVAVETATSASGTCVMLGSTATALSKSLRWASSQINCSPVFSCQHLKIRASRSEYRFFTSNAWWLPDASPTRSKRCQDARMRTHAQTAQGYRHRV